MDRDNLSVSDPEATKVMFETLFDIRRVAYEILDRLDGDDEEEEEDI